MWRSCSNILPLVRGLCTTLGAVHAAGYSHRRLHGGNIMVHWPGEDTPPQLWLLDFGVWHLHPPVNDRRNPWMTGQVATNEDDTRVRCRRSKLDHHVDTRPETVPAQRNRPGECLLLPE